MASASTRASAAQVRKSVGTTRSKISGYIFRTSSPIDLQKNNVAHRLIRIILELKFSLEDAAAALREDLNQNPTLACNELSSWPSNPGLKRVNAKVDLPVKLNPMTILADYEIPVGKFLEACLKLYEYESVWSGAHQFELLLALYAETEIQPVALLPSAVGDLMKTARGPVNEDSPPRRTKSIYVGGGEWVGGEEIDVETEVELYNVGVEPRSEIVAGDRSSRVRCAQRPRAEAAAAAPLLLEEGAGLRSFPRGEEGDTGGDVASVLPDARDEALEQLSTGGGASTSCRGAAAPRAAPAATTALRGPAGGAQAGTRRARGWGGRVRGGRGVKRRCGVERERVARQQRRDALAVADGGEEGGVVGVDGGGGLAADAGCGRHERRRQADHTTRVTRLLFALPIQVLGFPCIYLVVFLVYCCQKGMHLHAEQAICSGGRERFAPATRLVPAFFNSTPMFLNRSGLIGRPRFRRSHQPSAGVAAARCSLSRGEIPHPPVDIARAASITGRLPDNHIYLCLCAGASLDLAHVNSSTSRLYAPDWADSDLFSDTDPTHSLRIIPESFIMSPPSY
ncbi:hypothetical protein FB451DRAFT_1190559 [Mycena latifolia]|nr:hypothetical protein FB451DRAFT_1190559 [Mycena latifolia]